MKRIILLLLALSVVTADAASVITATITITNHANITGTNAELLRITNVTSGYVRTWTNSVADPTTQIKVGTNIATDVQALAIQLATYAISGLSPSSDLLTSVSLRGTNDALVRVALSPTNWGYVTYSTQTVGSAVGVRVPYTVESAATRTNVASGLNAALDGAENTNRFLTSFALLDMGRLGLDISPVSVTNGPNLLSLAATNLILRLSGASNNWDIAGISNGFAGRTIGLLNATTNTLTITNENALIAATNRILTGGFGANATITTNALGILVYDAAQSRWVMLAGSGAGTASGAGGGSSTNHIFGNSVWVDALFGNDSTGQRTNPALPFLTLARAKTNALAGDTIFVRPGIYNTDTTLLKSNVNWHFFNGAIVTNITQNGFAIFDDTAGFSTGGSAKPCRVTGYGEFIDTNYFIVDIRNSVVSIEFERMATTAGSIDAAAIVGGTGSLTLSRGLITNSISVSVSCVGASSTLTLDKVKIINYGSAGLQPAVFFSAAQSNAIIRDCVFVTSGATNSIYSGANAVGVRVYGSLFASTNVGPNVTFITGTNTVDGDVNR